MTVKKRSQILVEEDQKIVPFSSLLRLPVVQKSEDCIQEFQVSFVRVLCIEDEDLSSSSGLVDHVRKQKIVLEPKEIFCRLVLSKILSFYFT